MSDIAAMARAARAASRQLAISESELRASAVAAMARSLEANAEGILAANDADVARAREAGTSTALLDRLSLATGRLAAIAADMRQVAGLPDPVGRRFDERQVESGLRVHRVRVPIGVLGVIYEARPNVTADIAALAVKTGNAVVLRGGSETLGTNLAMVAALRKGLGEVGLPAGALQFVDSPDRNLITQLLRLDDLVDMIIPRGGAGLHRFCVENATVPVIVGGIGICHLFAEATCDISRSLDVVENAKCQRPSVCNALDTLLVDAAIAPTFLPAVVERLRPRGVRFRAEPRAAAVLRGCDAVDPAGPADFETEWMDLVLGLKVVDSLDEALEHIAAHGSHSDGILTEDDAAADRFVRAVDSAAVFVNASTRFNDGGQFGLGAEVAVSTQKLHARGPMGLEELTTYKWVGCGDYHTRR
ncbi:MAG: glutamate-5-semialdehyde dehydrogenase [Armatimonadota bacterium]